MFCALDQVQRSFIVEHRKAAPLSVATAPTIGWLCRTGPGKNRVAKQNEQAISMNAIRNAKTCDTSGPQGPPMLHRPAPLPKSDPSCCFGTNRQLETLNPPTIP